MATAAMQTQKVLKSLVPITRFNRGEAKKIFDEVDDQGEKIVIKNNVPVCILMNPARYEAIMEALEDCALYFEALQREGGSMKAQLSSDKIMKALGISDTELDEVAVEIE